MVARSGVGGASSSSAAAATDPQEPATPPATEPQLSEAAARWRSIVRAIQRIRRLQRIWGVLGGFLQEFPAELRGRLRETFPGTGRRR